MDVDVQALPLRDPKQFMAGQLGCDISAWSKVLENSSASQQVIDWLTNGVDISSMFRHFKGNFRGKAYDACKPPEVYMPNSGSCRQNSDFVARALEERLRDGSLELLGRYDIWKWPTCIMSLTLEPTKPRLCHDERFLNLFVRDLPFRLDTLREVPRMLDQGDLLCTTDEKLGYDHVRFMRTPANILESCLMAGSCNILPWHSDLKQAALFITR